MQSMASAISNAVHEKVSALERSASELSLRERSLADQERGVAEKLQAREREVRGT
jgi:hypothetical protein